MSSSGSDDNLDDFTLSQPDFYVYRKDLKQHNKEFLNARQESVMPFNIKSHSDYGALELAFAKDKSMSQKIWLKKNAYLTEQSKKTESELSLKVAGIRKPSTSTVSASTPTSPSTAKVEKTASTFTTHDVGTPVTPKSSSLISIFTGFWEYLLDAFSKWRQ